MIYCNNLFPIYSTIGLDITTNLSLLSFMKTGLSTIWSRLSHPQWNAFRNRWHSLWNAFALFSSSNQNADGCSSYPLSPLSTTTTHQHSPERMFSFALKLSPFMSRTATSVPTHLAIVLLMTAGFISFKLLLMTLREQCFPAPCARTTAMILSRTVLGAPTCGIGIHKCSCVRCSRYNE